MINTNEILDTIHMIDQQHLDVRTITMGISLLDCADPDPKAACQKIYDKITRRAEHLVATGEAIEREFGIPIVNKRISVTPMALVAGASETGSYVPFAVAMDNAAKSTGVNFIGGFSALVQKGATQADKKLIASIPEALAITDFVCSSVNVGSTRAGINMDAVAEMGRIIKDTAERTADRGGFGCAKLVVFCNAVEDNPFMAGAFHGVGEPDCIINVGVSGPGVVHHALKDAKAALVCEPCTANGDLKTGRKGLVRFTVRIHGKASHAGNAHKEGINAIEELAHEILAIQKLTDYEAGTTVNVGVCSGGTKPNVVPAEAEIEIDCRVKTAAEGDRVRKAINEIRTTVPGTTREVIERDSKMPMEETEANMALFEKAKICGEKVGLKFSHQFVGGGSDGNEVSAMGIPTLDGLGAAGDGAHSANEYILIHQYIPRIAMLA